MVHIHERNYRIKPSHFRRGVLAPPIEAESETKHEEREMRKPKLLDKSENGESEIQVAPGSEVLAILQRSEIDQQITTAKAYPRSLSKFRDIAAELIGQDRQSADDCIYTVPRGKEQNPKTGRWEQKMVKGPTARFAEILLYAWGNARANARTISQDDRFVTAMGYCYDLQQNTSIAFEVRRRITDSQGRRFSDDLVVSTSNAACSVALRNAILKMIPQPVWKGLLRLAEQTIAGDRKSLVERRQTIFDGFKPYKFTPSMVCQLVSAPGTADIGQEEIVALQGLLTALKDGDVTTETLLSQIEELKPAPQKKDKDKLTEQLEASLADEAKAAQAKLERQKASKSEQGPQKVAEILPPNPFEKEW